MHTITNQVLLVAFPFIVIFYEESEISSVTPAKQRVVYLFLHALVSKSLASDLTCVLLLCTTTDFPFAKKMILDSFYVYNKDIQSILFYLCKNNHL